MKTGIKIIVLVGLLLTMGPRLFAQSPLQTAKSDGAVTLDNGKSLQVNFAQSAFTIAFNHQFDPLKSGQNKRDTFSIGSQLSFKPATNGQSATLYNLGQDDLSIGGSFTLTLGLNHLLSYIPSTDTSTSTTSLGHFQNVAVDALDELIKALQKTIEILPDGATKLQAQAACVKGCTAYCSLRNQLPSDELHIRNVAVDALNELVLALQKTSDTLPPGLMKSEAIGALNKGKAKLDELINQPEKSGPGSLDFDALYLKLGYRHDQYTLVSNVTNLGSVTRNQIFDGLSGSLSYTAQFGYKTSVPAVFAVSIGEETINNSDSLTSVQVQKPLISGSSGITTVKTTSALFGAYKQSSGFTFDLDFILKPKAWDKQLRFGLDLLVRSDYASTKGRPNPGIALFLSPAGKPLEVQGAVVLLYNNSTDKAELNLVAGYNF